MELLNFPASDFNGRPADIQGSSNSLQPPLRGRNSSACYCKKHKCSHKCTKNATQRRFESNIESMPVRTVFCQLTDSKIFCRPQGLAEPFNADNVSAGRFFMLKNCAFAPTPFVVLVGTWFESSRGKSLQFLVVRLVERFVS